jgi:hypothetical protein
MVFYLIALPHVKKLASLEQKPNLSIEFGYFTNLFASDRFRCEWSNGYNDLKSERAVLFSIRSKQFDWIRPFYHLIEFVVL